jgi:hypothetical protein
VTHLCSHERLEAESTSPVIIAQIPSLDWLEHALPSVRRALLPTGRLMMTVDALPGALVREYLD